jgi:hypothetical protein
MTTSGSSRPPKITEEVGEGRSDPQSLSREPVYLDRPRVAPRVEQGRELSGLFAFGADRHHRDGQHSVPPLGQGSVLA